MSLSVVNISHTGYTNPAHFSQKSFNYEIWCLFTFCPYSINVIESTWKCVTLVKKSIFVTILFHTRKAALVRNYFSRSKDFCLHGSRLPSPPLSKIFDQINADILSGRVNYGNPATFTCPLVFLSPVSTWSEWGLKMQSRSTKVNTWSRFNNIWRR